VACKHHHAHMAGKCLCIVAAMGVLDGHLMLAQSWAWITMIHDRAPQQGVSAPQQGVTAALDSTFSGDAPCSMCCAIVQERQQKDEQAPIPESKPTAKFTPAMWSRAFLLIPPAHTYLSLLMDRKLMPDAQREAPPSPPPKIS